MPETTKCPTCEMDITDDATRFIHEQAHTEAKTRGLAGSTGLSALPFIFWPRVATLLADYTAKSQMAYKELKGMLREAAKHLDTLAESREERLYPTPGLEELIERIDKTIGKEADDADQN